MLGTVVGAGTFALPAAMHEMGILAGTIAFWAMALVVLATHLLYTEIVLRNAQSEAHRLPAQAGAVLGPWGRRVAYISHPAQVIGSSFIYLILGGQFLSVLASRWFGLAPMPLFWQVAFWVGGAATIFIGLKLVARVEAWFTWLLVGLLILSVILYLPRVSGSLFLVSHWPVVPTSLGVILFSLFGWQAIPEVSAIAGHDRKKTRIAVVIGSLGAAFLVWIFGVFAYAAIGTALGNDASQLATGLPSAWFWILPAVGFLAVATSFLILAQDLKAMLHLDLKFPKALAWAVALGAPGSLLFLTSRNFLSSVDIVGAVITAFNAILISLIAFVLFRKARDGTHRRWIIVPILCILVFSAVIIRRLWAGVG